MRTLALVLVLVIVAGCGKATPMAHCDCNESGFRFSVFLRGSQTAEMANACKDFCNAWEASLP